MNKIICPYCKAVQSMAMETECEIFPFKRLMFECEQCGKKFWVVTVIKKEYIVTEVDDEQNKNCGERIDLSRQNG